MLCNWYAIFFQDMDQQKIMEKLAAQIVGAEWGQLYPGLSKLAAIDLSIPISSVNCEHDFSTLNRVILIRSIIHPLRQIDVISVNLQLQPH